MVQPINLNAMAWVVGIGLSSTVMQGKHSSDPEWIMQDPRGLPDMVNGGHSNPFLGRNARVRR